MAAATVVFPDPVAPTTEIRRTRRHPPWRSAPGGERKRPHQTGETPKPGGDHTGARDVAVDGLGERLGSSGVEVPRHDSPTHDDDLRRDGQSDLGHPSPEIPGRHLPGRMVLRQRLPRSAPTPPDRRPGGHSLQAVAMGATRPLKAI